MERAARASHYLNNNSLAYFQNVDADLQSTGPLDQNCLSFCAEKSNETDKEEQPRGSSVCAVDATSCLLVLAQTTISFASLSLMWLKTASPWGKKWSIVGAFGTSRGEASGGGGKFVCLMSAQ